MRTLRPLALLALGASCSAAVWAQASCQPDDCNGISVGAPKVFDNRSLTLQIETLQQALQRQQASNSAVDLKSVFAALANTQGLTQSETSTVLSVLGNPTPATSVTTDLTTGNVDANGNSLPNTTDTQTTKNVSSVTPTAPSFDSFASVPSGFNPHFGSNASDLLNNQVNLSYQIMNLQMILERALSDRLYVDSSTPGQREQSGQGDDGGAAGTDAVEAMQGAAHETGQRNPSGITSDSEKSEKKEDPIPPNRTRLQAVLGFNVTIDPPRIANDAVAVVEVTLKRSETSDYGDLSLVAMMPQEKTYNSAALSSSSHAYSGAAVVNAFQVSGGYRKRNQTFYVYQDTDTLSYERMTTNGTLVFGWMFRPVLGRRSVSPGLRQLFAVVALPHVDCDHAETKPTTKSGSKIECSVQLSSTVRTYWKKFDHATQTSFERQDTNRARNFWFALSATLGRPQIFDKHSYVNQVTYNSLTVYSSAFYEEALEPVVEDVSWRPTGEKSVLVNVTGRNFFTNTQVKLGDAVYSEDNKNLIIKSEQSIDVITTFDQLTSGPSSILGRYGLSIPLFAKDPPNVSPAIEHGFQILRSGVKIGPPIDGYRTLEIPLGQRFDSNTDYSATYNAAKKGIDDLTSHLSDLENDIRSKQYDLDTAKKQIDTLQSSKKQDATQVSKLQGQINTLGNDLDKAEADRKQTKTRLESAESDYFKNYSLSRDELLEQQSPIISINGTALRMPYAFNDIAVSKDNPTLGYVQIKTTFPDSLITNGAALVQVSWPFYDPTRWTDTVQYTDPEDEFKVDRVSANTIVIRGDEIPFKPAKDNLGNLNKCWEFVAGPTPVQLATQDCQPSKVAAPPKPAMKPVKGKPAPEAAQGQAASNPGPPIQGGLYVTSVTIDDKDKFPAHAVLLAPDFSVYHLTIPDFPDKKPDPPKPVAMKQNDSTWITITLDAGKTAKSVEANGAVLPATQWRVKKDDSKTPAAGGNKPPQTIEVEVTRALTAKSGSVQITVLGAPASAGAAPLVVGTQTVDIACSQCSEKRGDQ